MKVFLHIGTNKTGSSSIQSALINNINQLEQEGFYLPKSKWDWKMKKGLISPGNGHELASKIISRNTESLKRYLKHQVNIAELKGLEKIIFSNEVLVRLFSDIENIRFLDEAFNAIGLVEISVMCYWRNAEQHALSLFKHRAKNGKFSSYKEWFENDYETIRLAKGYLENIGQINWDWNNRLYKKNVVSSFFVEFLGVDKFDYNSSIRVNTSLSLNALEIIRFFESNYSGSAEVLYKKFKELDMKHEESDSLVAIFNAEFRSYIKLHQDTLNQISKTLPSIDRESFLKFRMITQKNNRMEFFIDEVYEPELTHFLVTFTRYKLLFKIKLLGVRIYRRFIKLITKKEFNKNKYGGSL